ncbi:hypothetical protein PUMCH_004104 [Australozyma saopauloensis]|uniref:MYND-type domain-containing protein n=1 Tax=Australozyma saopauloensis TaxID=291208 RepID=A0AAX4HEC5_9ASCO|nr:hypothetical protein PUMCH_004104 [[Candida] saopauloensis]
MRESNYRSIANNRAAVTITTSLYDRRALDVTSDKPLVNSLNHLTYLVSSSAKVRETLANDGGIERLVAILHECQSCRFASLDALHTSEQKLLTAWKWTLAFQCIVLIGTRGTEKIRQKVVCAGMLPVIATIFDNYRCLRDHAFAAGQSTVTGPPACPYMMGQFDNATATGGTALAPGNNGLPGMATVPQNGPAGGFGLALQPNMATDNIIPQAGTFMDIRLPGNGPAAPTTANVVPPTGFAPAATATAPTAAVPVATNPFFQPTAPNPIPSLYMFPLGNQSPVVENTNRYQLNALGGLTCDDYDKLTIPELLKLVKNDAASSPSTLESNPGIAIRRRYLTVLLLNKLKESKENELPMSYLSDDNSIEMDTNLNFLMDLYLQDERSIQTSNTISTKIAPRNFTDKGIIIPRDDDVVWCLQLLAYVSKYPYLKDILQNTHLIPNMSIRERQLRMLTTEKIGSSNQRGLGRRPIGNRETLVPKSRKGRLFTPNTLPGSHVGSSNNVNTFIDGCDPSLDHLCDDLNIRNETFSLAGNTIEQYEKVNHTASSTEDNHESDVDLDDFDEDSDHKAKDDDEEVDEYLSQFEDNVTLQTPNSTHLSSMYDSIVDAESISHDLERRLALNHLSSKMSRLAKLESQKLSNAIIDKRLEQKNNYAETWNYNTYQHFDIDEDTHDGFTDVDESLLQYQKINLFPMVEQFTFYGGTDMYYWSGVIMRNSCRRNDFKGGVRQCGNLECGKWEKYPREFSKCKRCKRTKYCSRECQTRAWTCHKNWCVPSNSSNSTATNDSVPTQADANTERAGNVATAGSDGEGIAFSSSEYQLAHPSDQDSQPMDL